MELDEIAKIKNKFRIQFKNLRLKMSEKEKSFMDKMIFKNLTSLDEYKSSKVIYVYISKEKEVSTNMIIEDAWKNGKKVAVPLSNREDRSLDFYFINSFHDLKTGAFGIKEPIKYIAEKAVKFFENSVCIVPGLCFDNKGYRLGYGYGYYDRFLQKFTGTKIGICYSNCIKDCLPISSYDQKMDILVSDLNVTRFT